MSVKNWPPDLSQFNTVKFPPEWERKQRKIKIIATIIGIIFAILLYVGIFLFVQSYDRSLMKKCPTPCTAPASFYPEGDPCHYAPCQDFWGNTNGIWDISVTQ